MKISIDNGKVRKVPENDRFRFRAWHKPTKRLFEVWCFTTEYVYECDEVNGIGSPTNPAKLEDCVLEQCTGLKDKNGRLIYEGDIVKFSEIGVITWSKYAPAFICEKDGWNVADVGKKLEIIGNIHENPELLEEK